MRRFRNLALLAAVIACLALATRQTPIHAASRPATVQAADDTAGAKVYADNCAICHGEQREGNLPTVPPLTGIAHQLNAGQLTAITHDGKGAMPGNPDLKGDELAALLHFLLAADESGAAPAATASPAQLAEKGATLFQQNCAFCHGRDTMGGESGPDLTQSKIVAADVNGDKIGEVVHAGRPAKKTPAFNFSNAEIETLAAYIHAQEAAARTRKGDRRGVAVADLQTGDAAAGLQYFSGAGGCARCHSATGDLAGVANRYQGLALERRMLYPEGAKSKVTVTLPGGQKLTGTLAYLDEFTVALRDAGGVYHSWQTSRVKFSVDAPVEAHVDLFGKYTDADIHNLMAYLQTLR